MPTVEWRLDCENCRHLTVVGLHDSGPTSATFKADASPLWHWEGCPVWPVPCPASSLEDFSHLRVLIVQQHIGTVHFGLHSVQCCVLLLYLVTQALSQHLQPTQTVTHHTWQHKGTLWFFSVHNSTTLTHRYTLVYLCSQQHHSNTKEHSGLSLFTTASL